MKEKRNHLLGEVNGYRIYYEKPEKKSPEEEVAMKAITWSVVNLKRTSNCLEREERLLLKTNEELLPCYL